MQFLLMYSVIGDTYVDPEFGTGALKITPAHDINDYTLGKTHALESISILNKDGTMNAVAGERYAGRCRFECRWRVWEDMELDGTAIRKVARVLKAPSILAILHILSAVANAVCA